MSTNFKSGFIISLAILLTQSGTVAENNKIYNSEKSLEIYLKLFLAKSKTFSMSSLKPKSSI